MANFLRLLDTFLKTLKQEDKLPRFQSSLEKERNNLSKRSNSNNKIDNYFQLAEMIRDNKRKKDYKRMIQGCEMSLSLIPELIKWEKKKRGDFTISRIPAIEEGYLFACLYQLEYLKKLIRSIVKKRRELKSWQNYLDDCDKLGELAQNIIGFLKHNSGFLQNELKNALNEDDGRPVARAVTYLEKIKRIRRERVKGTYALYLLNNKN